MAWLRATAAYLLIGAIAWATVSAFTGATPWTGCGTCAANATQVARVVNTALWFLVVRFPQAGLMGLVLVFAARREWPASITLLTALAVPLAWELGRIAGDLLRARGRGSSTGGLIAALGWGDAIFVGLCIWPAVPAALWSLRSRPRE